jgi:hypothetical protein
LVVQFFETIANNKAAQPMEGFQQQMTTLYFDFAGKGGIEDL